MRLPLIEGDDAPFPPMTPELAATEPALRMVGPRAGSAAASENAVAGAAATVAKSAATNQPDGRCTIMQSLPFE